MLGSMVCRYSDFSEPWYRSKEAELKIREIYSDHSAARLDFVNRKFWEWCVIAQALEERSMLRPGRRGLGFAVGTEPLPSYFAAKGCNVLATDLDTATASPGWVSSNQHAEFLNATYHPQLIDRAKYLKRTNFQFVDMRNLERISGRYDFVWSSCALEHLGSLQAGSEFVLASSRLLEPRGIAVHTTEFNVRSNDNTIEEGDSVIYRQRDILELSESLRQRGFSLATPCFDVGSHCFDVDFDSPPYMEFGKPHLKLEMLGHVCTSFLLIIERVSRQHSFVARLVGGRELGASSQRSSAMIRLIEKLGRRRAGPGID